MQVVGDYEASIITADAVTLASAIVRVVLENMGVGQRCMAYKQDSSSKHEHQGGS
jgi:hypothetical protein